MLCAESCLGRGWPGPGGWPGVQIEHSLESVLWMGDMRQIPLPTRELSVAFFRKMYEAGNKMLFYRIG